MMCCMSRLRRICKNTIRNKRTMQARKKRGAEGRQRLLATN
jgi:hypothetical protein